MLNKRAEVILSVLLRPFLFVVYFLCAAWPRNPRLWVFGCWDGRRFADNSAALYRYCNEQPNSRVRTVWITRSTQIARELRAQGYCAYHAWTLGGLVNCLKAGVFVFDGQSKDINHWLSNGARKINLQHGVAGHKTIERNISVPSHRLYQLFHGNLLQRIFWSYLIPWHEATPDMVIAAAEQQIVDDASAYGVSKDKIAVTGLPRNDMLFEEHDDSALDGDLRDLVSSAQHDGKGLCLYMPTFRDNNDPAFPFSWSDWDRMLEGLNVIFIAHKHFSDANAHPDLQLSNVRFVDKDCDLYPLFHYVDCLVTDYSSVAFDFMLVDKPIIYFVHDFDKYIAASRKLRHDFDTVTPGPKVGTLEDLAEAIHAVMTNSSDGDKLPEDFVRVRDYFQKFLDSGSSARVYDAILARFVEPP